MGMLETLKKAVLGSYAATERLHADARQAAKEHGAKGLSRSEIRATDRFVKAKLANMPQYGGVQHFSIREARVEGVRSVVIDPQTKSYYIILKHDKSQAEVGGACKKLRHVLKVTPDGKVKHMAGLKVFNRKDLARSEDAFQRTFTGSRHVMGASEVLVDYRGKQKSWGKPPNQLLMIQDWGGQGSVRRWKKRGTQTICCRSCQYIYAGAPRDQRCAR